MSEQTLLIEIGCEELPPKALDDLANAFAQNLRDEFAACAAAMPSPALTIDTGRTGPAEAAETIVELLSARSGATDLSTTSPTSSSPR